MLDRASKTHDDGERYRIDDLARKASTTVRNVRAYQERGLLAKPMLEGRVGWYGPAHLERLKTIAELLERGYSLGSIAELLQAHDAGTALGAVLGLEEAALKPFEEDVPLKVNLLDLAKVFRIDDPALLKTALDAGFLDYDEKGEVRVASAKLLKAGRDLVDAGIPPRALLEELIYLRKQIEPIAERLVRLVVKHVFDPHGEGIPPLEVVPKLTEKVVRVRPLAASVVHTVLARSLDKQVRRTLEDRKGAKVPVGRAHAKKC